MGKNGLYGCLIGISSIATAVLVHAYGKLKYYQGRISKYDELMPILEAEKKLIDQLMEERKSFKEDES